MEAGVDDPIEIEVQVVHWARARVSQFSPTPTRASQPLESERVALHQPAEEGGDAHRASTRSEAVPR
eukprot:scaffold321435_cov23-Tisochrysis_lutea.AAC.1